MTSKEGIWVPSDTSTHNEGMIPTSSFCIVQGYQEDYIKDTPVVHTAYKRVDKKIKPVPALMPEDAKVTRKFPEDPLTGLPELSPSIPDFVPTTKLTQERINKININPDGFLWPEEEKLFKNIL